VVIILTTPAFVFSPAIRSAIANEIPPSRQGQLQGGLTCLASLGTVFGMTPIIHYNIHPNRRNALYILYNCGIGPLLVSGSFSLFVGDDAPAQIPGAPFFLTAFIMLVCAVGLVILAYRRYVHTRLWQPQLTYGLTSPRSGQMTPVE
jgi:DHA1 family tetracycline resistance protein-like MFS transporter